MPDDLEQQFEGRLRSLDERIHAKLAEFERQGALHGAEREAAANWKLRHRRLAHEVEKGEKPPGEIAEEIEVLKLSFERWLARIDRLNLKPAKR